MSDILDIAINNVQNSKSAFCRFITVNDTGKNGSHQSGFYIPKCASSLLFEQPGVKGEIKSREVEIKWQDDFYTNSRLIYYGQKSRNEYRITRFGGKSFPFFEEDNVGDLLIITRYGDDEYYGFVLKNDNDIEEFFAVFNLSSNKTNQLINISKETQFNSIYKSMINTILDKYNNFPSTNEMANHAREIYNSSFKIKSNQILSSPDRILLNWINTEYRSEENTSELQSR